MTFDIFCVVWQHLFCPPLRTDDQSWDDFSNGTSLWWLLRDFPANDLLREDFTRGKWAWQPADYVVVRSTGTVVLDESENGARDELLSCRSYLSIELSASRELHRLQKEIRGKFCKKNALVAAQARNDWNIDLWPVAYLKPWAMATCALLISKSPLFKAFLCNQSIFSILLFFFIYSFYLQ